MKLKKTVKVFGSLFLALSIVLGSSPAAWALNFPYSSIFAIGQGTEYYQVEGTNGSGLQSVHYVEYSPNDGVTPMIAYGSKLYGKSTITYVADYLEKQGKTVIAGINADFFDTSTGIPIGIVINEGVFISSNLGSPAIGFKADGSAIIGTPASAMYLRGENGSSVRVSTFNKTRSKYNVALFDENFGATTKTTTPGTNVILEKVNDDDIVVNGAVTMQVVAVNADTAEAAAIKSDQMVLSASSDCETDIVTPFAVGEKVTFSVEAENNDWDDVVYAVAGKVMLNNGSVDVSGSPVGNNPRSAVGIKADGTVVLYEVDGRQKGLSIGMTMEQLAEEMKDLGCVDAINLDGGGSSSVIVKKTGESKYGVVNSPSDGSLRKCANYIMLVSNGNKTGAAEHLGIYPEYKYMMKNTAISLGVKAADSAFYAVSAPQNVQYSVVQGQGSVESNIFTAGESGGSVVVAAQSGSAKGEQNIYVVDSVDSLTVIKSGTAEAVDSLSLNMDANVNLDVYRATFNGRGVKAADSAVKWSTTIGAIDDTGNFAAGKAEGSGNITVSYGSYVKTIPVTVKDPNLKPNNLDNLLADFEKDNPFKSSDGKMAFASAYGYVHNGRQSLQVECGALGQATLNYTGSNGSVGNAVRIYGWFKGGNDIQVDAVFRDSAGNSLTAAMAGSGGSDFVMCSAAVPAGAVEFTGFVLQNSGSAKRSVYLDQIVLSGKYDADTIYPTVKFDKVSAAVDAGKTALVKGNVSDTNGSYTVPEKNIHAYVDGKEVSFTINELNGNISFDTPKLTAGLHRITVEAADVFGNISRKSVDIKAGSGSSAFADMKMTHWSAPYVGFVAAEGIVKGETMGGKTVFNPERNLTRAEFAVIMARYLGLESSNSLSYADKKDVKAWAQSAVAALYEAGVMTGSEQDGKLYFYPNNAVTRQEVMTVISKALPEGYYTASQKFTDSAAIPAWSLPHINKLVTMGIVNGYEDGSINPTANITRAEIAKIIYGLY